MIIHTTLRPSVLVSKAGSKKGQLAACPNLGTETRLNSLKLGDRSAEKQGLGCIDLQGKGEKGHAPLEVRLNS